MTVHYDVVIIGGGIAGASLGSAIADRRRVLILEMGGTSRIPRHWGARSPSGWKAMVARASSH